MFVNLYTVYGVVQPDNQTMPTCIVCIHSQLNTGSCESHSDQILFFRCVATHGLNRIELYSTRRGTFLILRRGIQITIDIESEGQSDSTNIRYSYQQELLYFRGI